MEPFDYVDGKVIEWGVGVFGLPIPLRYWSNLEEFGEFLDDGIELYNEHLRKESVPLVFIKGFYEHPD